MLLFISNIDVNIYDNVKKVEILLGGTWGTFEGQNAGEPWDFFKQLYFENDQGKSYFFAQKSPKSPQSTKVP